MRVSLAPSRVTLRGLLKYLAWAEDHTFSFKLFRRDPAPLWRSIDWSSDPDDDTPEELLALWLESVERTKACVAEALASGDMSQPVHISASTGEDPPHPDSG